MLHSCNLSSGQAYISNKRFYKHDHFWRYSSSNTLICRHVWAQSIQPKFRPVRPGKVHLKRWTRFFEKFSVGPNRSIEFWTELSGNFGWMNRAQNNRYIPITITIPRRKWTWQTDKNWRYTERGILFSGMGHTNILKLKVGNISGAKVSRLSTQFSTIFAVLTLMIDNTAVELASACLSVGTAGLLR